MYGDEGCCLECESGYEGCWCDSCSCKECDDYMECDCGSGKGYCSRVNSSCSDCRNAW